MNQRQDARGVDEARRYVFVIRSLDTGGAERQLTTLACGLKRRGIDISVITFYAAPPGDDTFAKKLTDNGVRIVSLDKSGRWDMLGFMLRYISTIRSLRPALIMSYLEGANILAVLLRRFHGPARIVIRIATSYMDLSHYDWLSRLGYKAETWLSGYADLVMVNSQRAYANLGVRGRLRGKLVLVPNAVDTGYFKRDAAAGRAFRSRFNIAESRIVVGMVARMDPMKDHDTFLHAAKLVNTRNQDVTFVCVGGGDASYLARLKESAAQLGGFIIWVETQSDMVAVYSALDIHVLSSIGEGSPNTVAEAMSCETPCVVTDVGDAAFVVGDTGVVVAPRDSAALAEGICTAIRTHHRCESKRRAARQRIVELFSVEHAVLNTLAAFTNVCRFEGCRISPSR